MNEQKNEVTGRERVTGWIADETQLLEKCCNKENHVTRPTFCSSFRSLSDRGKAFLNSGLSVAKTVCCAMNRYSAFDIVTRPRARRLRVRGSIPYIRSVLQSVQTGYAAQPVSYTISNGRSFP
jgi:hypothetical protein